MGSSFDEKASTEARLKWALQVYESSMVKSVENRRQVVTLGIVPWDAAARWQFDQLKAQLEENHKDIEDLSKIVETVGLQNKKYRAELEAKDVEISRLRELMNTVDCECSMADRLSGHATGCFMPEFLEKLGSGEALESAEVKV